GVTFVTPVSSEVPERFSLNQNYPNPFNPKSKIKMQIAELSEVKLVVYDVLGREVQTLVNEQLSPGTYEVDFDGTNLPSGVYFYRIIAEGEGQKFTKTMKMILVK
ncbi:MAG: T9SS type A sorting domain-containing protein, partial [Ignavibacteria bacterium]|nr:T9SS type A sorting domain-containing protein [Ignavibacteria bacterium]